MKELREKLYKACKTGDITKVSEVLEEGADINARNEDGDSILSDFISYYGEEEIPNKFEVVKYLLDKGADPNLLGEERSGPLTYAMLEMDNEMTELLCSYGADPNLVGGFVDQETFYDWAEFDYRYEVYDLDYPEDFKYKDGMDEDTWLDYLQSMAVKYGEIEPKHLYTLRKYGAKGKHDLSENNRSFNGKWGSKGSSLCLTDSFM